MNPMTLETRPVNELIPYARNPRNNDDVVDKMVAAIREFGFRIPIVAKRDGTVVDGHLRLKAAKKLNLKTVPVVLADELTDAQIKAFRLLANRSANWASWDDALLKIELEELAALEFDLSLTGFDTEEIQKALNALDADTPPFIELDPDLDTTPEQAPAVTVTQSGDLWQLGDHRLLCGDSLLTENYERLLQGHRAHLTFADPPYNTNYGTLNPNPSKRCAHRHIANDHQSDEHFSAFLHTACTRIIEHTEGAIYICMSGSRLHTLQRAFVDSGGHHAAWIVWAKHHFTLGHGHYQRQHETLLYGWTKTGKHYWCGDRQQSDVWFIDKPAINSLHLTMKPVALMGRAITNSSQRGDLVLDPFGGSGSTLMACEHHRRRCAMMELEPRFVDTIIERWQRYTKQEAVHGESGQTYTERQRQGLADHQPAKAPQNVKDTD